MKGIQEIRKEIDDIDKQIFGLLKERLNLVIGTLDVTDSIEDLQREDDIFRSINEISESEFENRYIGSIYLTVFMEGKKIKDIIKKNRL